MDCLICRLQKAYIYCETLSLKWQVPNISSFGPKAFCSYKWSSVDKGPSTETDCPLQILFTFSAIKAKNIETTALATLPFHEKTLTMVSAKFTMTSSRNKNPLGQVMSSNFIIYDIDIASSK